MGTLYVVATPIGNLSDITQRAAEILRAVPLVIAEDTRVTRRLLNRLEAESRLISYHRHSRESTVLRIIDHLRADDAALVSDAGTPGVNDPGAELVARAADTGIPVTPLPGPSSITAALSVSGFSADRFTSYGYLPASGSKRRRTLREIAGVDTTSVFFEGPHRVSKALADMCNIMPGKQIVVCREMTKLHEEVWRGSVEEATQHFTEPRGEFVVVVAPH